MNKTIVIGLLMLAVCGTAGASPEGGLPLLGAQVYPQGSNEYNDRWNAEQARRQAEFSQREYQQRQLDMQQRQLREMERQSQAMEQQNRRQYVYPYWSNPR
jgi:hypothetical protein